MIPIQPQRILSRGDLPSSLGGIYNPGALSSTTLLVRREADYTFRRTSVFTDLVHLDPVTLGVTDVEPLALVNHHTESRIEDCRPFDWRGESLLVTHTTVRPNGIKPGLSALWPGKLERLDDLNLPLVLAPVEKNWVLAASPSGRLFLIYSLDPLTIFRWEGWNRWVLHVSRPTGWTLALGKPPRLSTHLLPFDDGYLGWWHTILDRWYVHGAFYLDQDFRLAARTGILFDGQWVTDGYKPGVMYVSSQVDADPTSILLFYGEGDAHTGCIRVAKDALRARLWPSASRLEVVSR